MKCAKCGLDLPQNVKACPKCGMVNEFIPSGAPAGKVKPIVYVIAALGAVALLALVFAVIAGRGGVTSAPTPVAGPPGSVTSAPPPQPGGGGVMSAPPAAPGPAAVTPPGVGKPKPPQSVVDYLEFVKKVEAHRQLLLKDTVSALTLAGAGGEAQNLMNMIDMASDPEGEKAQDPLAATKKELLRQNANWVSTLKYFDGRPAPPECREFSGAYREVLYRETKAIAEIAVDFNKVNIMDPKDMGKLLSSLQKMKADPSIQANIDKSTDNADARLNQLASYYDMPKPFDVPREQKSGSGIMGF